MNWEALSAIATTIAVVIALWPVYETWCNRRATAVNIRAQLFLYFTALRPSVARRFMGTPLGPQTNEPLSGKDLELLQAIEALIPQAVILPSIEHDLVLALFTNLTLMKMAPKLKPQTGKDVLALIDEVIKELLKGKCMRGKSVSLPWSDTESRGPSI